MFALKARKSKTKQATEVGIVKAQLKKRWWFEETYGHETKYKREQCLGLPRSHANDAVAICCHDGERVRLDDVLYLKRHVAAGDYQQTKGVSLKESIEEYFQREVLPHVPDAWIDHSKTKVGYEIPLNRHFYRYEPPRKLSDIEKEIKGLKKEIIVLLQEVTT